MRRRVVPVAIVGAGLLVAASLSPARAAVPAPQCFGPADLGSGIVAKMCFTEHEGPSGSGAYIGLDEATSYYSFAAASAHFVRCTEHWWLDNISAPSRNDWTNDCFQKANRRASNNPKGVLGGCTLPVSQVRTYVTYRLLSTPNVKRQSRTLTMQVHC